LLFIYLNERVGEMAAVYLNERVGEIAQCMEIVAIFI